MASHGTGVSAFDYFATWSGTDVDDALVGGGQLFVQDKMLLLACQFKLQSI